VQRDFCLTKLSVAHVTDMETSAGDIVQDLRVLVDQEGGDVVRLLCAVESVWRLCSTSKSDRDTLGTGGVCELLSLLLKRYICYQDAVVQLLGCVVCLTAGEHKENQSRFQVSVEPLITIFDHYCSDPVVMVSAVKTVFYLCLDYPPNRAILGDAEFPKRILNMMPYHWNNAVVLNWSTWALVSLAKDNAPNKLSILKHGVGFLPRQLDNHSRDIRYATATLLVHVAALGQLAQNELSDTCVLISSVMHRATTEQDQSTARSCARALLNLIYDHPHNLQRVLEVEDGVQILSIIRATGWKPWIVYGFLTMMEHHDVRVKLLRHDILVDIDREILATASNQQQLLQRLVQSLTHNVHLHQDHLQEYAVLLDGALQAVSADMQLVLAHVLWRVSEFAPDVPISNVLKLMGDENTTMSTYGCQILVNKFAVATKPVTEPGVERTLLALTTHPTMGLRVKAYAAALILGMHFEYELDQHTYCKAIIVLANYERCRSKLKDHVANLLQLVVHDNGDAFQALYALARHKINVDAIVPGCVHLLEDHDANYVLCVQCLKILASVGRPSVHFLYGSLQNTLKRCMYGGAEMATWASIVSINFGFNMN